jgi:hypothetical protein
MELRINYCRSYERTDRTDSRQPVQQSIMHNIPNAL